MCHCLEISVPNLVSRFLSLPSSYCSFPARLKADSRAHAHAQTHARAHSAHHSHAHTRAAHYGDGSSGVGRRLPAETGHTRSEYWWGRADSSMMPTCVAHTCTWTFTATYASLTLIPVVTSSPLVTNIPWHEVHCVVRVLTALGRFGVVSCCTVEDSFTPSIHRRIIELSPPKPR